MILTYSLCKIMVYGAIRWETRDWSDSKWHIYVYTRFNFHLVHKHHLWDGT